MKSLQEHYEEVLNYSLEEVINSLLPLAKDKHTTLPSLLEEAEKMFDEEDWADFEIIDLMPGVPGESPDVREARKFVTVLSCNFKV